MGADATEPFEETLMRMSAWLYRGIWLALAMTAVPLAAKAQPAPRMFPANKAADVNPDAHLVLTFDSPPVVGTSGKITIYDAADHSVVDILDLSIAPSPHPDGGTKASTQAEHNAEAAAQTFSDYQVNVIGGQPLHFFPIIVHDKVATIYPHNNRLKYGHTYGVKMDASVLKPAMGEFAGVTSDAAWTFTTKARATSARTRARSTGWPPNPLGGRRSSSGTAATKRSSTWWTSPT